MKSAHANLSPPLEAFSDWIDFGTLKDQRHSTLTLRAEIFGLKSEKFIITLQSKQRTLK